MANLKKIVAALMPYLPISTQMEEHWGYLRFSGKYFDEFYLLADALGSACSDAGLNGLCRVELDGTFMSTEDLTDALYTGFNFGKWKINLNKQGVLSNVDTTGSYVNFFLTQKSCLEWLSGINALDPQCPINAYPNLLILVGDLARPFGNSFLKFTPIHQVDIPSYQESTGLPKFEVIQQQVHIITPRQIVINLNRFILTGGDIDSPMARVLNKFGIDMLAISLVHEFHSDEKVILEGVKRISLKVGGPVPDTKNFCEDLIEVVKWVYEDKVSVRKKLFTERLGLDVDGERGLIENLYTNLHTAFDQAKQRYNFVIIERKDAYLKELRELLKDIKTQSELYSTKIRALLTNFLRDLLAAIILIGFTIFTKFSDSMNLDKARLLEFVFYTLAAYYIFSIIMQLIVDIADIRVSKKELLYWKTATKDYIPEKDFLMHIDKSMRGRKLALHIIYPIIALCYIIIAIACFKYPVLLDSISKK